MSMTPWESFWESETLRLMEKAEGQFRQKLVEQRNVRQWQVKNGMTVHDGVAGRNTIWLAGMLYKMNPHEAVDLIKQGMDPAVWLKAQAAGVDSHLLESLLNG